MIIADLTVVSLLMLAAIIFIFTLSVKKTPTYVEKLNEYSIKYSLDEPKVEVPVVEEELSATPTKKIVVRKAKVAKTIPSKIPMRKKFDETK